jgi:antitoxin (DNA-binding transcriptional repressor) of toxin-antitoxin stability system
MQEFGAFEAKTHLLKLLEEVTKGSSNLITKHGMPIALLSPPPGAHRQVSDAIVGFKALRATLAPLGFPIRELIEEGP